LANPKIYEVNFALKRDTQTLEKVTAAPAAAALGLFLFG
jgi:hypothetical protein